MPELVLTHYCEPDRCREKRNNLGSQPTGLVLRRELLQLGADPPFRAYFARQKCVSRFEHMNHPSQALLDEVVNVIDEATDDSGGGQQRTPVRILQRPLRPGVLGSTK